MHEETLNTIRPIAEYDDGYGLYWMDIRYGYDLDRIIERDITDDQSAIDAIIEEVLPGSGIRIEAPRFGCTAFSVPGEAGILMGRNYDFKRNTSAMAVSCHPDDGYRSLSFAALDNLSANTMATRTERAAALLSPFVCLDGINEKGVCIAVLILDSPSTHQDTGKPRISTSTAVRLVLDRCSSADEAVDLLRGYDMHAIAGRDYHFFVTDRSGDSRAIEYDCESPGREMSAVPTRTLTNFFRMHIDEYGTDRRFGHGKDRYDRVESILEAEKDDCTRDTVWRAMEAASQTPSGELTGNTQWSVLFDTAALTAEFTLHRRWSDRHMFHV